MKFSKAQIKALKLLAEKRKRSLSGEGWSYRPSNIRTTTLESLIKGGFVEKLYQRLSYLYRITDSGLEWMPKNPE